jgi:N-acetylglucosamine kinase-like BadF-type ATPase
MCAFYLGADLGSTKTHVIIADADGRVVGFGKSGPGNHESVGYAGFQANLQQSVRLALAAAGLEPDQVSGSGFGIAGYDWPIEYEPMLEVIRTLHLGGMVELVNDAELGLLAGSERGWGVAVVSGTGCNCRGWDATRQRRGRITGGGAEFGEFAGASELMFMVTRALAYEWTGRGPATQLSAAFVKKYGVRDLEQLLQDSICHKIEIDAADAPLVFQVAAQGDPVALEIVRWAGRELGEMAVTVIRQLEFQSMAFDLVQIGSMFDGSPLLTDEMKKVVHAVAPGAKFIRSYAPPVMGAVLLGMEVAGVQPDAQVRSQLTASISGLHWNGKPGG